MDKAPANGHTARAMSLLLALERRIRNCRDHQQLALLAVNECRQLVPYRQATLFSRRGTGAFQETAFSSVPAPDRHAPMTVWLRRAVRHLLKNHDPGQPHAFQASDLPPELAGDWPEWLAAEAFWQPLTQPGGQPPLAGLWLTRVKPWSDGERQVLDHLGHALGHAWHRLALANRPLARLLRPPATGWWRRILTGLLLMVILALPVRLSVLAPASIVPETPLVVAPPLEGVIKEFFVTPNQTVNAGQPLFSLDETTLESRFEVAKKSYEVVRADFLRATRKGFSKEASKAEARLLEARLAIEKAEVRYAGEQLSRITVRAPRAGIAVFGDANDWLGKPVRVGEKIVIIADPAHTEVEARVPVDDAIILEPGAPVTLFLNIRPVDPLSATLYHADYEAGTTPRGLLAFRIKARLKPGTPPPRIGLQGTAKIEGQTVSLFYYLFRSPLSVLRQWVGW